jgi:hypothetical protein
MRKKYSYRYKKGFAPSGHSNEWLQITTKQKANLEKMNVSKKLEFKENKPPEPTPSMED